MAEVVGWTTSAVLLVTLGCWYAVPTARYFVLFFLPGSFSRPVVTFSRPSRRLFVLGSRSFISFLVFALVALRDSG